MEGHPQADRVLPVLERLILLALSNDTRVSPDTMVELLGRIASQTRGPTTLVLDNARYQRCAAVEGEAKRLVIELLFLPSYSAERDRVSMEVHEEEGVAGSALRRLRGVPEGHRDCLDRIPTDHRETLDSLMTVKFQTFDDTSVLAA